MNKWFVILSLGVVFDQEFYHIYRFIGIEVLDAHTNKMVKVIFEVIIMNLLVEMEKVCCWKVAVNLLEYFTDWDSLVTSQVGKHFIKNLFYL